MSLYNVYLLELRLYSRRVNIFIGACLAKCVAVCRMYDIFMSMCVARLYVLKHACTLKNYPCILGYHHKKLFRAAIKICLAVYLYAATHTKMSDHGRCQIAAWSAYVQGKDVTFYYR